jgi:hypothetical protein
MLKRFKIYIVTATISIILISCIDVPNDFVAPVWDVRLEVPVVNRTYTIQEAIENDTLITAYDDPDRLGQLYYSDHFKVEAINVNDNLKFDGFTETISKKIDAIKVNTVDPVTTEISLSDWTPLTPGTQIIFPEIENESSKKFTPITSFNSATIESGSVLLTISNNLPVATELHGFRIENIADNSIVVENSGDLVIPPFDSVSVIYDLSDKIIMNELVFRTTLYTPGSNGQPVQIPGNAGTGIKADFQNLVLKEAVAQFPEQDPFGLVDEIEVGDSIFYEKAIFNEGRFNISFDNYIDLDLQIILNLDNLKRPDGTSFRQIIDLEKNERNRVVNIPFLEDWSLASNLAGQVTNLLSYTVDVKTSSSDEPVKITKDDSIGVKILFEESTLKYYSGRIKPQKFNLESKTFDLNLGTFDEKFDFTDVFFDDPGAYLNFVTSANVEFELNGTLSASNQYTTKSIDLENILIGSVSSTQVDLKEYGLKALMNSFTNDLPNKFEITGDVTINPGYKFINVYSTDSISLSTDMEIPLRLGIGGGTFTDTLTLNTADSSSVIENINYAELTMELVNNIPADVEVVGTLIDSLGNVLLNIPTDYNEIQSFKIPAPTVDKEGNVLESGKLIQMFDLRGEDVKKFLRSPNLAMKFTLITPPETSTLPVIFRTTDNISVKMFGTIEYRVDIEGL